MGNRIEKPVETPYTASQLLTAEEYTFLLKLFGIHPGSKAHSASRMPGLR